MSGGGLAADSQGFIYLLAGNGTFDTTLDGQGFPVNGDYGNGMLKISPSPQMTVADYFEPYDTLSESDSDLDLGSGGVLVLPDLQDSSGAVHHLLAAAGKNTHIYVANRDSMGKFNPNDNSNAYQDLDGALSGGSWSTPAYFNGTLYYGTPNGPLQAFPVTGARLSATPSSRTTATFHYPGATPTVSANGTSQAIVWAVENTNPAVLHAYDATNLAIELYNSNQANTRDQFGPAFRFVAPVVANGRVFVGAPGGVAEFGLLR